MEMAKKLITTISSMGLSCEVQLTKQDLLMKSVYKNNITEVQNILIDYPESIDIDKLDHDGLNPIHVCAALNYGKLMQVLLSFGALINQKNINGYTSLHIAAACGNEKIVRILLKKNANLRLKCRTDEIPLQVARTQEIHDLIVKRMKRKESVTSSETSKSSSPKIKQNTKSDKNNNTDKIEATQDNRKKNRLEYNYFDAEKNSLSEHETSFMSKNSSFDHGNISYDNECGSIKTTNTWLEQTSTDEYLNSDVAFEHQATWSQKSCSSEDEDVKKTDISQMNPKQLVVKCLMHNNKAKTMRKNGTTNSNFYQEQTILHQDNISFDQDNTENNLINHNNTRKNEDITSINQENISINQENITITEDNTSINQERISINQENITINQENTSINQENNSINQENTTKNEENTATNQDNVSTKKGFILINPDLLTKNEDNILSVQNNKQLPNVKETKNESFTGHISITETNIPKESLSINKTSSTHQKPSEQEKTTIIRLKTSLDNAYKLIHTKTLLCTHNPLESHQTNTDNKENCIVNSQEDGGDTVEIYKNHRVASCWKNKELKDVISNLIRIIEDGSNDVNYDM